MYTLCLDERQKKWDYGYLFYMALQRRKDRREDGLLLVLPIAQRGSEMDFIRAARFVSIV